MADFSEECRFAIDVAQEAGALIMKYHGREHESEWLSATNFRTHVDQKSDELIRKRILARFPDDDIFSEEQDPLNRGRKRRWVYDPIDGTIPFVRHTSDNFSVAVSLVKDQTPVLGVVWMPRRRELYVGETGRGAYCNNARIKVSEEANLNRSIIGLDGGKETKNFKRADLAEYVRRMYSPDGISCFVAYGCASVPLCQVASGTHIPGQPNVGRLDGYVALSLEPWDMAAEVPIIREAGGLVTNLSGEPWTLRDPSIIAANPELHRKLYDHLTK